MRNVRARVMRILAVDPTSRGFGFAVMEGPDLLVDWGVVQARTDKNRQCLERIGAIMDRYRPHRIVIEDTRRGSRRRARVRQLLSSVERLAAEKSLALRRVSQDQVRKVFPDTQVPGKYPVAVATAKRFPELAARLPPPRKPWNSEAEMMAVFDAVALGAAYYFAANRRRTASGEVARLNPP